MNSSSNRLVLRSQADHRRAIRRAAELRAHGATAETNDELARLDGAIATYVAEPGKPAARKGRPAGGGAEVP